tara:strand:+ start:25602 stop:26474 length:873 start_codon:yes stop_codon:yes gene_type:complete
VLYTADNAKLQINGNEILASNASLALNANLQPSYLITQRNTNTYAPSNGIGGQLSFNYYLTGRDYFKSFITGQGEKDVETTVISGNFGGLNFDSGYLTSYSVNFGPNAPAVASANVQFFDQLEGEFVSGQEKAPEDTQILNLKNASVVGDLASGEVENFIGGTYNYSCDVTPVYLMNETKPSNVSFGAKTVNVNFEIDNPTGYLPVSGTEAKISLNLKNYSNTNIENFTCSGLIQQRSLASAVGDYIKQSITIVQNSTEGSSIFIDTISAGTVSEAVGIGSTGSDIPPSG